MPLSKGKSPKAFKKNMEIEMKAGKPQKQSLAIAYNMQSKNKKKMSKGGMAKAEADKAPKDMDYGKDDSSLVRKPSKFMAEGGKVQSFMKDNEKDLMGKFPPDDDYTKQPASIYDEEDAMKSGPAPRDQFARGGMIDKSDTEDHYSSIADAILAKKRKAKMMAEGGMVDIEHNAQEDNADAAVGYEEAAMKENYDDDFSDMDQPMDSNEDGDDLSDEDKYGGDLVSSIRKKMKSKR